MLSRVLLCGVLGVGLVCAAENPQPVQAEKRLRISSYSDESDFLHREMPVYPPLAKNARVHGTVRLTVVIGKDGSVRNIELVSGHPLLVGAAMDAVKYWRYRPYLLNGKPVEVITTAEVNFSLDAVPASSPALEPRPKSAGNWKMALPLLAPSEVEPQISVEGPGTSHSIDSHTEDEEERMRESPFRQWLLSDPDNESALEVLAALTYQHAEKVHDVNEKTRWLDESASWYTKLASVNPEKKEAFYSLGVIAWSKWYPALIAARAEAGMKPEDPGPFADRAVRLRLRTRYWQTLEDGIANLKRALEIDPEYDAAMAYLNLLYRERADLRDTDAEYAKDVEIADEWLQKTLETRKKKTGQ